jgi:excisionase family DNA binding protein
MVHVDITFRYPIIVRVIFWENQYHWHGFVPDFEINLYELFDPTNTSQEFMFQRRLRRMIGESLAVCKMENQTPPAFSTQPTLKSGHKKEEGRLISVAEAAKRLECSEGTIRSLFERGKLTGEVSEGGHRKIFEKSVETLVKKQG